MLRVKTANGVETRKAAARRRLDDRRPRLAPSSGSWPTSAAAVSSGSATAPTCSQALTAGVQDNLSAVERFNLVTDTWASVAGRAGAGRGLPGLARLFADETDRNVWVALFGGLEYLNRVLPPADRPKVEAFVRDWSARPWRGSAGSARPGKAT